MGEVDRAIARTVERLGDLAATGEVETTSVPTDRMCGSNAQRTTDAVATSCVIGGVFDPHIPGGTPGAPPAVVTDRPNLPTLTGDRLTDRRTRGGADPPT